MLFFGLCFFDLSYSKSSTEFFSALYKTSFHLVLKSSETGVIIAGDFFIFSSLGVNYVFKLV